VRKEGFDMEGAAARTGKEGTSDAGIRDRPMDKRESNPAEERVRRGRMVSLSLVCREGFFHQSFQAPLIVVAQIARHGANNLKIEVNGTSASCQHEFRYFITCANAPDALFVPTVAVPAYDSCMKNASK
jgi:hypothetical protein